jgi:hypothetical protein
MANGFKLTKLNSLQKAADRVYSRPRNLIPNELKREQFLGRPVLLRDKEFIMVSSIKRFINIK